MAKRLKINVGGRLFETTEGTLLRHPTSMLAAWARDWADRGDGNNDGRRGTCDTGRVAVDTRARARTCAHARFLSRTGPCDCAGLPELFVDRSPVYFELVLDWMRTNLIPALPPSVGQRNLIEEARYYGLPALVHDLEHLLYRPTRYELYQLMLAKDLAHTDLSGMKLAGRSLAGFNLTGTNLAGADLTGADLTLATGYARAHARTRARSAQRARAHHIRPLG